MWIVEDFRDAPMRPRAMFEREDDAREWARVKFGSNALVRSEGIVPLDRALSIVNEELEMFSYDDIGFARDNIEGYLRGAA